MNFEPWGVFLPFLGVFIDLNSYYPIFSQRMTIENQRTERMAASYDGFECPEHEFHIGMKQSHFSMSIEPDIIQLQA